MFPLLVFLSLLSRPSEEGLEIESKALLDSLEVHYIKEGLRAMNMTLRDLEYFKEWVGPDSFRLRRVSELMNFPLRVPEYADMLRDSTSRLSDSLHFLLLLMARETDVKIERARDRIEQSLRERIHRRRGMWEDSLSTFVSDSSLISGLALLLSGMEISNHLLDSAFLRVSIGEKDSLLREAILLWSDEDDSTDDTLKGVLQREFGMKVDTSGEIEAKEILKIAEKIDRERLLEAGMVSLLSVYEAFPHLKLVEEKEFSLEGNTSIGRIAVGGVGENHYEGDYSLIVDLGGDDSYRGRIGGGIGLVKSAYPTSLVVDLRGDDYYSSEKTVSQGAGVFGVGILWDGGGSDYYSASHVSQGAGLFGVGILLDLSGSDTYRAGFFTQASGNFGWGILRDLEGDDSYRSWDWAQGFGSVWGCGMMIEEEGDDSYYAGGHYIHHPLLPKQYRSFAQGFGMGWRSDASGGIGLLLDREGNDSYYVEVYGQGCSYWYSLGLLIDEGGNDTYNAAEYAQGAGVHLSVGLLADLEGKDHYFSRYGPSQGEGHDLAVGWLIDKEGNDTYQVSGGQGIGLTNSVGIFIDSEGDDTYLTTERLGQGDANWVRGFGGIGIFLDLQGKDTYEGGPGGDNEWWIQGSFGVGIDEEAR